MSESAGEGANVGPPGEAPGALSRLLDELARAPHADPEAAWGKALRPGDVLDRFEILRELGRGGFGAVYEALDRGLGRKVALKTLRPGRSRDEWSDEALRHEAQAAASLSHPGIVTLYEACTCDRGPYLVMELLRGETLESRLSRGPLPAAEAVEVGLQMARALAHVHGHELVHRDLKPGNVFLGEDGRVKLLDLGLAHLLGRKSSTGGTPAYVAPEQWRGEEVDGRADAFALGAVLFEMVSGRRAFEVKEERSSALDPGPAPVLGAKVPRGFARLVARCLAKEPSGRPTAAQAAEELLEIQRGLARPKTVRRVRKPRSRGVQGAEDSTPGAHPSGPVTLAVLPLANLSGDPSQDWFSDGMTDEITCKLSRLRGLAVAARSNVARFKGTQRGTAQIGRALGVAYLVEGSIRRSGDRLRVGATLVKAADGFQVWSETIDARLDDIFDVQERVATRIVEALQVRLSPEEAGTLRSWGTRNPAAYDEYLRGQVLVENFNDSSKLEAARGHFERALQLDPRFAPAMAGLASAEAQMYRNVSSDGERLDRARALVERALEIDPGLSRAVFALGEIRGVSYDYVGAAQAFREVTVREPRNHLAWDYLGWALGWATPPLLDEAERACRRAIEVNPAYGGSYYHLSRVLVAQGRLAEAEQSLVDLGEHLPGSNLIDTGWFWLHLGAGRPREALAALDRQSGDFAKGTSLGKALLAMALAQLGEPDRALSALGEALDLGYRDVPALRGSPYLEPLRGDRGFAPLLARHGISLTTTNGGAA